MGKPVILVVDHYVPTYDRDAGSKTTWQYLKMFVKKGYVVKFLGDNFLHEEPYSTMLQQMGIEILYGPEYLISLRSMWILLRTIRTLRLFITAMTCISFGSTGSMNLPGI